MKVYLTIYRGVQWKNKLANTEQSRLQLLIQLLLSCCSAQGPGGPTTRLALSLTTQVIVCATPSSVLSAHIFRESHVHRESNPKCHWLSRSSSHNRPWWSSSTVSKKKMASKWPGDCSSDILTKDEEAFCPYPKKYVWDQIYWLNINLFAKLANLLCQSFYCWFLSFLCAPLSSYFCGHQGIWPQKTKSEPQLWQP